MTFPIRKSTRKLTGIVKITIPEVFPEMKPLGNVIIFPVPRGCVACTEMWIYAANILKKQFFL